MSRTNLRHFRQLQSVQELDNASNNTQYAIEDFVLSAFSVFYLQCPSFLSYQQAMETEHGNNNARTLFGIEKIPTDNQLRTLLDEEKPEALLPMFDAVFAGIEAAGGLDNFRGSRSDLLVAFDGVEHHHILFSSWDALLGFMMEKLKLTFNTS